MKNTRKGFIVPLIIGLIAILLVCGGIYVYKQKKQPNQSTTEPVGMIEATPTIQTPNHVATVGQNSNSQEDSIKSIEYIQANSEQKVFLDRVVREYSMFQKDKLILFYFDLVKNIAVVGSAAPNADSNYEKNNLFVGFFHPASIDSAPPAPPSGQPTTPTAATKFQEGGLFVIVCKDASTLSSSCSYVTDKYLVFFIADDSVGPGGGSILAYKAGNMSYDEKILKESSSYSLGGTYVKEYSASEAPIFDTLFDGKKITASLYKNNQYLGMGYFDLTRTNEKLRTMTFELNEG